MNLVVELPWIQISFECYDSIRIPYMERTCWCVYGGIDVLDVGTWLEKKNLLGGILYGEGETIEVSADVGGRAIWPGSLRDKRPYGGIDYKEIYGPKQIFY